MSRLIYCYAECRGTFFLLIRYLVIDEADRVMEDVQNDWLTHVENAVFCSRTGGDSDPAEKLVFAPNLNRAWPTQLNVENGNQPDQGPML